MRAIIIAILICVSVILSTSLAHPQIVGVTLDNPSAYQLEQDDLNLSVSGYIAGVSYNFLGLAIEKYTLSEFDEIPGLKANVTMLDVFIEVPSVFWVAIGLGVGYGRATFNSPSNSQYSDAALWQIFGRIGLGVKYLTIHIGRHRVRALNNSLDVDLSGFMDTIGVMVIIPLGSKCLFFCW